jgi:hypothetical protein
MTIPDISPHELPDWMRQARRGLDWGVLVVIAFSLTTAWSFIVNPNLPHTNASENYVYRTADYATAIQEGRLYPRWSPNALGGYGAPIPQYYPPGAPYTAALIQILLTNDPITAVRITYIVAICLAGAAVYGLVMRRAGAAAGVLAGVLYVYSPYLGLTAPHILGDLPGVMGMALIPALLWSIDRLLLLSRPLDLLFVTVTTCGLCLTNIHTLVMGFIFVLMLVLWHRITRGRRIPQIMTLGGLLLGIGAASVYWLPAVLEFDAVHWRPAMVTNNYQLTLAGLLSPLHPVDPNEMLPTPQWTIGLIGIVFGLIGAILILRFRRQHGFQGLFLGAGIGIAITGTALFPHETWLCGPITLCLAISSSAVLSLRERVPKRWQRLFLPLLLIMIWIGSSSIWFAPQSDDSFGGVDSRSQVLYEQQGYGTAVLPARDSVPSSLPDDLGFSRYLLDSYQTDTVNKLAPGQLTTNVQISLLAHNSHSDRFQVRIENPILLNMLTAYFPGWGASISGRDLSLTANPETHLIQVDVPLVQSGELVISLGSTPVRSGAWIITVIMVVIIIILTVGRWRRAQTFYDDLHLLTNEEARLLGALVAVCGAAIILITNAAFPISLQARAGYGLNGSTFIENRTNAGISLLAFRLDKNQYRPGNSLNLTLYWQAQRFLPENYQARLYLLNPDDNSRWNETALHNPGNYPTRRWNTGRYVSDVYSVPLSASMPPGNYQIIVEVYSCKPDCTSGTPLLFFDDVGQLMGRVFILPTVLNINS